MQLLLRIIRKIAAKVHVASYRLVALSARVERKATRMLIGTDYSLKVHNQLPVEQIVYNAIPYTTPINPSLPAINRSGTVSLVVPSLIGRGFYGGVATAIIFAAKLSLKLGMPLRIIQTVEAGDGEGLDNFFRDYGINIDSEKVEILDLSGRRYNFYGYLDLHPDDVYVVSAWWDAQLISGLPLKRKFVYMIQDFEPIFYPNGDMSALAESTYHLSSFIPVCNTRLMYVHMSNKGYSYIKKEGLWFEPAVSRLDNGLARENTNKRRLFLYGRPSVDRNLFNLALLALNQTFSTNTLDPAEWEVFMAGQDSLPNIALSGGVIVQNLGKMDMGRYLELIKTIDVAISPMLAPHPNYPTLEFASVGAAVATTRYENKQDLTNYSHNIVMADPTVESLSQAIVEASRIPYATRIKNATNTNLPANWDEALEPVLSKLPALLYPYHYKSAVEKAEKKS
jgi:hypothetical protein